MRRKFKWSLATLAAAAMLTIASQASAGEVTGRVVYPSGQGCGSCRITAQVGEGLFTGGTTDPVFTSKNGDFRITYKADTGVGKIYVNGTTRHDSYVKNGGHVLIRIPSP